MTANPSDLPDRHPHDFPHIRVVRDRTGSADVFLDGWKFPFPLDAGGGIVTTIDTDYAPKVTVTLLGSTVFVEDRYLEDLSRPGGVSGSAGDGDQGDDAAPEGRTVPEGLTAPVASPFAAAAEQAPTHPALRWETSDGLAHRRVGDGGPSTACGQTPQWHNVADGWFRLADRQTPACSDCFG